MVPATGSVLHVNHGYGKCCRFWRSFLKRSRKPDKRMIRTVVNSTAMNDFMQLFKVHIYVLPGMASGALGVCFRA